VVYRIQLNPIARIMVVHPDRLAPYQETARTSGLKEGAAGAVGE
jgi:hypothetical protein